ncbi:MAG TPA: hypothetical protein VLC06_10600 [Polyangia bacterium]|nr:hypothetical protein [Polyangia bacterium]
MRMLSRAPRLVVSACLFGAMACSGGAGVGGNGGSGGGAAGGPGSAGHMSGGAAGGDAAGGGAARGGAAGGGATGGSPGALVNPTPGSSFFVGANFWNIDWEGQGDYFQSGVDFTTTTNPWLPQLLSDLAPYHVLRFMDWNQTNDSNNPQAVWSTRKQKTDPQSEPVAFEWQIDLCNRTKKDYWLNVPHEASAAYWTQLAQLVSGELDPSLRVYLEWSNEVWNGSFPQNAYAMTQGQSLGLAGSDPAASFYVYQAVRLYEAFEAVFGAGSPRLVKVLSGQAAYDGPCTNDVKALSDTTINPNRTMPDVYAVAPYLSGTTVAAVSGAITGIKGGLQSNATCAAMASLPLVSYEGGSDSYAATNCQAVQTDPGMHDVYTSYLDALVADGLQGPFMQYTHSGSCWGMKVKTSDAASASPKYQGLLDWLAAHP